MPLSNSCAVHVRQRVRLRKSSRSRPPHHEARHAECSDARTLKQLQWKRAKQRNNQFALARCKKTQDNDGKGARNALSCTLRKRTNGTRRVVAHITQCSLSRSRRHFVIIIDFHRLAAKRGQRSGCGSAANARRAVELLRHLQRAV